MCAKARPWRDHDAVMASPWWAKMMAEAPSEAIRESYKVLLGSQTFNVKESAIGISAHWLFCHSFDMFMDEEVDFDVFLRLTEEACDHLFVYYYYTVPSLMPRSLTGLKNATATFQVAMEAAALLIPRQSPAAQAKVQANRAYS